VQELPKNNVSQEATINYRHIIKHLLRKPGAFNNYKYKECLFPSIAFRKAYDLLLVTYGEKANKKYLEVLHLAAINNENDVTIAINLLIDDNKIPILKEIKSLLDLQKQNIPTVHVEQPCLSAYDALLQGGDDDATFH